MPVHYLNPCLQSYLSFNFKYLSSTPLCSVMPLSALVSALAIAPPTFNEFGIWYFVFGLFVAMGFAFAGFILLADPDPQYDVDSLKEIPDGEFSLEKRKA